MVNHPPDWCAKRCGYPLDPVLIAEGWTMHPGCEFPIPALSTYPQASTGEPTTARPTRERIRP